MFYYNGVLVVHTANFNSTIDMGLLPPVIDETSDVCNGELKGSAKFTDLSNVTDGSVVVIYEAPLTSTSLPIASAIVQNGLWEVNDKINISGSKKYCAFTIENQLFV